MVEIHGIQIGKSRAYLIKGSKGYVLFDSGSKGNENKFFNYLDDHGIVFDDIKLIIISHVHFDHVGSLAAIKKKLSCPIAVYNLEANILEEGVIVTPTAITLIGKWTSIISNNVKSIDRSFDSVKPDILISDGFSLKDFGVNGNVYSTPGHSNGSVSLILEGGEAFIGDLAIGSPIKVYPPFVVNKKDVLKSWKKIIDLGAKKIYPAHGKPWPFSIEKIAREYKKHTKH